MCLNFVGGDHGRDKRIATAVTKGIKGPTCYQVGPFHLSIATLPIMQIQCIVMPRGLAVQAALQLHPVPKSSKVNFSRMPIGSGLR
jgi:hypothetical protein